MNLALVVALMAAVWPVPATAGEAGTHGTLPDLAAFATSVADGNEDALRGVYAERLFALRVLEPPNAEYISSSPDTLTRFTGASPYGVVGLLAHNYRAGGYFFDLDAGQSIALVFGDGRIEQFVVTEVHRFRATQPRSTTSDFVDLRTGELLTTEQAFRRFYMNSGHVTFQTCIERDGALTWGRLFVVAAPRGEAGSTSGAVP